MILFFFGKMLKIALSANYNMIDFDSFEINEDLALDCDNASNSQDFSASKVGLSALAGAALIFGLSAASSIAYADTSLDLKNEKIDAFDPSTVNELREEVAGKKLVVALVSDADHPGSTLFQKMGPLVLEDFEDMPEYVVKVHYTDDIADMQNILRDYAAAVQKLDGVVMYYHGSPHSMEITHGQDLTVANLESYFKGYGECFTDKARILLSSCSTGKGLYSIAQKMSDVIEIEVMAPKYIFAAEINASTENRMGEIAADSEGRLSFDLDNFRLYSVYDYEKNDFYDSIGTLTGFSADAIVDSDLRGKVLFLHAFPGQGYTPPEIEILEV